MPGPGLILNPKDYIRFPVDRCASDEVSDASGTGFYDVKHNLEHGADRERPASIRPVPAGGRVDCSGRAGHRRSRCPADRPARRHSGRWRRRRRGHFDHRPGLDQAGPHRRDPGHIRCRGHGPSGISAQSAGQPAGLPRQFAGNLHGDGRDPGCGRFLSLVPRRAGPV